MLRRSLAAAAPLLAAAVLATPAPGAVTATTLTSPEDGAYITLTSGSQEITFAGTAPGAANGDKIDIWCVKGTAAEGPIVENVVVSGGAFSVAKPGGSLPPGTCRAIAVPDGADAKAADANAFKRVVWTTENRRQYKTAGSGSPDVPVDFYITHQQPRGMTAMYSSGSCGLCGTRLFYDDTKASSEDVFHVNGFLDLDEDAPHAHSGLRVDGHNAWNSNAEYLDLTPGAPYQAGSALAGVPPLTHTVTGGGRDQDMTVDESTDLVRCEKGDPWPVTGPDCGRFVPVGLRLERRSTVTNGGTLVAVTDVLHSTDGRPHAVDAHFTEGMQHLDAGFQFPWVGPGYATHKTGDSVPGTAAPASIYLRTKNTAPDGDRQWAQGVIVYDRPIGKIDFVQNTRMLVPVELSVPAGGSVAVRHTYVMATTRAELDEAAAGVEDLYVPPAVAITSPPDGARTTEREVEVRGTASDNKGVASVTVNGRTAAVAADGTWAGRVTLEAGDNAITAIARDAAGNEATETRRVLLEAPHNVCCAPPPPPLRDVVAPVLGALSLTNRTFAVASGATAVSAAAKRGTVVRYTLSEPASVRFAIARATKGRRAGGRCRKATRRNRRGRACTRYVKAGRAITRRSPAGASALRFTGRIGRKALRPARYRMAIAAADATGNRSKARRLTFRIVRR